MIFHSILTERHENSSNNEIPDLPDFYNDLNLNQIVDGIIYGKHEYNLKPFFYTSLNDIDMIKYRQETARELENETLLENIKSFAKKMSTMRQYLALADKLDYRYFKEGWFLEAVEIYCEAVNCLSQDLSLVDLNSRGFLAFRSYLKNYVKSDQFVSLLRETKKLKADLSTVKYCVLTKGLHVRVYKYESEIEYTPEVEKTFERFKQGDVKDYRVKLPIGSNMNHVEAQILGCVAKIYPEIFQTLTIIVQKTAITWMQP
jgi:hypothetical protein